MDWPSYKRICDRPDVFSRWMIEQTCDLLGKGDLGCELAATLAAKPLTKPSDHRGSRAADMFVLVLRLDQVVSIEQAVARAASDGRTTADTRTRGIGGFVETWKEYRRHLEADGRIPAAADHAPAGGVDSSIHSNLTGKL